jgi:hypothetical protein
MTRLMIAVVAWIGAVVGAVALSNAVAHQTSSQQGQQVASVQAANQSSTGATPAQSFDPQAVKPTDPLSLFREKRLAAALAIARRRFGASADVEQAVVRPGQLQLILISRGSRRVLIVDANGAYQDSYAGPLVGTLDVFNLSQVQARVPGALERRIAAFGHVPPARLDYMVVSVDPIEHRFHWLVYPKGGAVHFQADGATSPIQVYGSNGARTLPG